MNDEMILKADNLYYSYDDDNSHSLNGLSLEVRKGPEGRLYGGKRQREIHLLSLLHRNLKAPEGAAVSLKESPMPTINRASWS